MSIESVEGIGFQWVFSGVAGNRTEEEGLRRFGGGLELLRPGRCKKHGRKLASKPISEETLSANFFQKFG